ncbi:YgjP-like metallopeptidase domain-containing protein [Oceanisphaera sp. KMM 10153]|uniref:YgjP-like metallopeptidase domain-containing protein n=1 Tax=Oceanisphaera submarina TaxID=3390193 RepID=UPI0039766C9D
MEYILVHELVHLLERHHNERFRQYMYRYLPDWQERRTLLNSGSLSYEGWGY